MPLEIARSADDVRDHLAHNLRSASADDVVRDHVRVVLGPQPYRHNHYSTDQFFRFDPAAGAVTNVYGQRLLRVTGNFVRAMTSALTQTLGPEAASQLLYKVGLAWGAADMRTFVERIQQEYEVEFEKVGMGTMLESWWWPLRAAGWGAWRYDFRHARNGLILIDLQHSAIADALGPTGRPVCHLYSGLFAAAFSRLAHRDLAGVELRCAETGGDRCQFLVAAAKRVQAATGWRDEGMSVEETMTKLSSTAQT